jgi:uncharacterized protein with FMN-binding domain
VFGSIAVLIIGWQAGAAALTSNQSALSTGLSTSGTTTGSSTTGSSASGTPSPAATPSSGSTTASPKSSTTSKSYTGQSVNTQFGSVQVRISVTGGKLTDVTPLHLTDFGGRSVQISNYAVPILRKEVLSAQSSHVNSVGGATYTSEAYLSSLQSALDTAGITS